MTAREIAQFTVADLQAIASLPENSEKRFELLDGELISVNPPRPLHAFVGGLFYVAMHNFSRDHDLGYAFPDAVGYILYSDKYFIPDASFVIKARLKGFPFPDEFRFAPDLAVEVLSPGNRPNEMMNKVRGYLEHGTTLVWVADIDDQVIDVYRLTDAGILVRRFGIKDTLSGEEVLPGFTLEVKTVFPDQSTL